MDGLRIVVCVKQVPEITDVKVNPETHTLIREGVPSMVNPYDLYAVEEAIRIREKSGGKVTIISMGPPQAEEAVREVISMGADDAVLLTDRAFAGADTWATATTLAAALKKTGFDLIICGKQAIDGDTAQVGPELAEFLGIPSITFVSKVEGMDGGQIKLRGMMEEGYQIVDTSLPCLLTVVKEINEPRIPSLRGKLRAKSTKIEVWSTSDLALNPSQVGLDGSPTRVVEIFTPAKKRGVKLFTGEPAESVQSLVSILRERGIV